MIQSYNKLNYLLKTFKTSHTIKLTVFCASYNAQHFIYVLTFHSKPHNTIINVLFKNNLICIRGCEVMKFFSSLSF